MHKLISMNAANGVEEIAFQLFISRALLTTAMLQHQSTLNSCLLWSGEAPKLEPYSSSMFAAVLSKDILKVLAHLCCRSQSTGEKVDDVPEGHGRQNGTQ